MYLLQVVLFAAIILAVAYRLYGRWLSKWMALDEHAKTPAVELRDDKDFEPIEPKFLISQHFSAIAAAGPIVGPIVAGRAFGWLPALIWILVGSIFIGGIHDMTSLVASVRHKARSIAEVVRVHMSRRSYVLFLAFIWIALIYIVVAFTDITARSFIGKQTLESGQVVTGGGIATSSLLYLVLPMLMGALLRFTKVSLGVATLIFVPLVGVAIWAGQKFPFDVSQTFGMTEEGAVKAWAVLLLAYCFAASIAPMWLLLQPRGHLGGYFLFVGLGAAAIGLFFGGHTVQYPAFIGWSSAEGKPLFPILFVTIACGACSGFHSVIASGTTSKQLKRETDARVIGYGTMLLEALVSVTALGCVMMLSPTNAADASLLKAPPNMVYAMGLGRFTEVIGIPASFVVAFGLMAFTTFVYDTLDVCTRLGRYIVQELIGRQDNVGRVLATALTAGVPLIFVMQTARNAQGKVIPIWSIYWDLFGASNQLLAALTLVGVTVWLLRTLPQERRRWVPLVTGIPAVWMYVMSVWALVFLIRGAFWPAAGQTPVAPSAAGVACVLVVLAALVLVEAIRALRGKSPHGGYGHPAPTPDLELLEHAA
jgi:carbon starvation protein